MPLQPRSVSFKKNNNIRVSNFTKQQNGASNNHQKNRINCMGSHGCLMDTVAWMWVYAYHSIFSNSASVLGENNEIRMNLIQQDLLSCAERLACR